jgi:glycosyltransferase involved in cell wall biosynthesis
MRVFYLDPGLCTRMGHHAARCSLIVAELRARGIETRVLGHVDIDPGIRAELDAQPHFRHLTYWQSDGDPLCGWLSGFQKFAQITFEDLMRLDGIASEDLVYLSTAFPIELTAITGWMARLAPEALPSVVVDFSVPSGIRLERTGTEVKIVMPDPLQNARPILYRFASTRIEPHILPRLRLITFESATAEHFQQLLERRVDTLPMVYEATTGRRNRVGKRPIVAALLGHQQRPKGYHMAPKIVRLLLARRPELRFLIHNADPNAISTNDPTGLVEAQQSLRDIALTDDRVQLSEEPAGKDLWSSLLERSDLVLCPYSAQFYKGTFSGVANEAIANGIPIVGPAGTGIEALINEFDGAGTVFERQEPSAIADAAIKLFDNFDRYAALAHKAAMIWPTRYGIRAMVDAVLAPLAPSLVSGQVGR